MSSILTNKGSMVALQTLRSINDGLAATRVEIATGQSIDSTRGPAMWAISKVMEADVAGFKKISDNLALGESTVAVARSGAETITALLSDMKQLVVAAQVDNVDRQKIQTNIESLREQIDGIVGMASFNGQNLLQNTDTAFGSGEISVQSSLDRTQNSVQSSQITIRRRDLSTGAATVAATGGSYDNDVVTGTLNATRSAELDTSGVTVETGAAYTLSIFGTDADGSAFDQDALRNTSGASQSRAEMASNEISYVARDGDRIGDVNRALVLRFAGFAARNEIDASVLTLTANGTSITATSQVTDATDTISVNLNTLEADAGNTIGGGLDVLAAVDVTTDEGARAALGQMEGLVQTAINQAAALGSDERRLETQAKFVEEIGTTLRGGIGKMLDVDMVESSARLQALEAQQQLAIKALSIANSAPQALLGLFR